MTPLRKALYAALMAELDDELPQLDPYPLSYEQVAALTIDTARRAGRSAVENLLATFKTHNVRGLRFGDVPRFVEALKALPDEVRRPKPSLCQAWCAACDRFERSG